MRRLGAGGMGVVYLAEAPDGGHVAVKVMHPAWVAEPGFPQRFEREVEAIRRVAPFCTAPVLDHAVTEDEAYTWGAVVTFAGTGEPPFGWASPQVMFYRLMHQEPRLGGLPGRLRALVARALDKRPERRPEARELIDELAGRPVGESAKAVVRSGWSALGPVPPTERDRQPEEPGARPSMDDLPGTEPPPSTDRTGPARHRPAGRIPAGRGRRLWIAGLATGCVALTGFALHQVYGTADAPRTDTAFQEGFDSEGDWPRAATAAGTARYYKGGYLLQPLPEQGMAATAPVAADRMISVRVSTTARMQVGSGEYGIWCGGTPVTDAQSRYSFSITTDGRAGITKEGRDGARWELVPFRSAAGVVPSGENRIEAECRFGDGGGAALRMLVNGRQVAAFRDRRAAYGPGAVGVAAVSRAGAPEGATARYESFTVRRPPR